MTAKVVSEEAYTIAEVAALKSVSEGFVRAAIRSDGQPHPKTGVVSKPLKAKRVGKGYRIGASAVDAWWKSLEDA